MERIKRGFANKLVNQNEEWIKAEVYDLYLFLQARESMRAAPHRFSNILRSSIKDTSFGWISTGLVSANAFQHIEREIQVGAKDPSAGLERDHIFHWAQTALFFLDAAPMNKEVFWAEMRRRNEVCFVLPSEHLAVSKLQRKHGLAAYQQAGIAVYRLPAEVFFIQGLKGGVRRAHWPKDFQVEPINLVAEYGAGTTP